MINPIPIWYSTYTKNEWTQKSKKSKEGNLRSEYSMGSNMHSDILTPSLDKIPTKQKSQIESNMNLFPTKTL